MAGLAVGPPGALTSPALPMLLRSPPTTPRLALPASTGVQWGWLLHALPYQLTVQTPCGGKMAGTVNVCLASCDLCNILQNRLAIGFRQGAHVNLRPDGPPYTLFCKLACCTSV